MTTTQTKPQMKTSMLIRRPARDVFEAFVDPDITTTFWFTKSTGRLDTHDHVRWDWEMYDVHTEVDVVTIEKDERIVIEWSSYSTPTRVQWEFAARPDGTTYVTITETGFTGDGAVDEALASTEGFAYVLAGAKAWLEHGIDLRLVPDKFPDGAPGA
jgi:uncharacterized protein YndB with AHSA1/START domain